MSLANPQSYWDPSSEADLRNELLADCRCCLHPSCDSVTCIKDQHAAVWGMTALFADSYILELPLPSLLHSEVCTTWWVLWHNFRSNSPGRCCLALELLIGLCWSRCRKPPAGCRSGPCLISTSIKCSICYGEEAWPAADKAWSSFSHDIQCCITVTGACSHGATTTEFRVGPRPTAHAQYGQGCSGTLQPNRGKQSLPGGPAMQSDNLTLPEQPN